MEYDYSLPKKSEEQKQKEISVSRVSAILIISEAFDISLIDAQYMYKNNFKAPGKDYSYSEISPNDLGRFIRSYYCGKP